MYLPHNPTKCPILTSKHKLCQNQPSCLYQYLNYPPHDLLNLSMSFPYQSNCPSPKSHTCFPFTHTLGKTMNLNVECESLDPKASTSSLDHPHMSPTTCPSPWKQLKPVPSSIHLLNLVPWNFKTTQCQNHELRPCQENMPTSHHYMPHIPHMSHPNCLDKSKPYKLNLTLEEPLLLGN